MLLYQTNSFAVRSRLPIAGLALALFLASGVQPAHAQLAPSARTSTRVIVVELQPHGFVPQEIHAPAGPFVLVVANKTGRPMALDLKSTTATPTDAKIVDQWVEKLQRQSSPTLHLAPGYYSLIEYNHSAQPLRIVVTP